MVNKNTIPIVEKRRAKRLPVPVGTIAFIKNSTGSTDKVYVGDISAVGILVYGYYSDVTYPVNTLVNDIVIAIPPCELRGTPRISLFVKEGKVVRVFFDQVLKTFCYGIELMNASTYIKGKLESLTGNN